MPFSIIPFLLLAIPVAEIAVFIIVGGQIGVLWTLALILVTAVIGSILLRVQGFQVINRLREETNSGRIPGRELGHGAMILVAGVLLLTPGFVTDALGFSLFIPPVRDAIWAFLASRVRFVGPGESGPGEFGNGGASGGFQRYRREEGGVVDLDPEDYHQTGHHSGEDDDGTHEPEPPQAETGVSRPGNGSPWKKH